METKFCNSCKEEHPVDCFYTNGVYTKKDGTKTQKYKPSCKKIEARKKVQLYNTNILEILEELNIAYECVFCGYSEHTCALDFHHLDNTVKTFGIGSNRTASKKRLKEEIQKCIILCANCHRVEHFV